MNEKAREKIIKARINLLCKRPFFAHLALLLILKETSDLPRMGTDGTYLYYNPEWINQKTIPEIEAGTAHEGLHCGLLHHIREDYRDHITFNIACDLAENPILKQSGFIFPPDVLSVDPQFMGMTAEKIYSILMGNKNLLNKLKKENLLGKLILKKREGKNYKESKEYQKQKWMTAITTACQKAGGNIPLGIQEFIKEFLNPQVDWEILLKRYIESIAKNNSHWYPANKRFIWQGLHLPSWKTESLGNLIFAVDLSGSMSNKEVQACISEVKSVIQNYCFENIWVLSFDTQIHSVDHFEHTEINPEFKLKGRGGTDIKPVFDWVEENNVNPSCLICMTDMGFNINFKEPFYPVIWITTTETEGPFGKTVRLKI